MYKSLLSPDEKDISENIPLVVVNMKSGTMKVVNIKFPKKTLSFTTYYLFPNTINEKKYLLFYFKIFTYI